MISTKSLASILIAIGFHLLSSFAIAHSPQSKEIIIVAPWEITSADPSKSGEIFQRMQLAETLVDVDSTGQLIPALAESWSTNEEATVWTFKLRPHVLFHDGTPLTAQNVLKSLITAQKKPSVLNKIAIDRIEAPDNNTVKIILKQGLRSLPAFLTHYTTLILADASFDQDNVTNIIGTGPFKLKTLEPPQSLTAEYFEKYWGKHATIHHVKYLATSRSESRTLMAESADNYVVYNLDAASVNRLRRNPDLHLQSKSIARTIQLKMNIAHPLFDQIEEREVLSGAINRKGIANAVLRFKESEADQILPPTFAEWQIHTSSQSPDYNALRQKLIHIGYTVNADGILEKDGKPLKFTLRTFSDRPELPLIATALQNQWKQLGADVHVAIGNFSEIPAGHNDGTLEMALYARNYGILPDPLGALLQDFAPTGSDWGVMNWHDEALSQALTALETETALDKIKQLKQQVSQRIYQQKPLIPIVYYQQTAVSHKSLKGLKLDPFERSFHLNELSW